MHVDGQRKWGRGLEGSSEEWGEVQTTVSEAFTVIVGDIKIYKGGGHRHTQSPTYHHETAREEEDSCEAPGHPQTCPPVHSKGCDTDGGKDINTDLGEGVIQGPTSCVTSLQPELPQWASM